MKFNYFYNIGSLPFQNFKNQIFKDKILSFWNGNIFKNFFYTSTHEIQSLVSPSIQQFFFDSFNYSINRIKKINQDLAVNPFSKKFEKTVSQSNFSLNKFLAIGAATFALQIGATAIHNHNFETDFIAQQQISSLKADYTFQSISPSTGFSSFLQQSISNSNPIETLKQDIPKEVIKIPKYMKSMFKTKEEAFLHLLNVAEGKQDKFYRDNKGIAIAYGWNPTRNTKEFNLQIAKKAGLNEEQIDAILKVSDTTKINYVPKDLKKIKFSSEQVQKTALALMPHYEQQFLDAMAYHSILNGRNPDKDIATYHDLPNNQQAVMIHMAYKVGGINLINYKTFYKKFFNYLDKPNKFNLNQVQKNFQYTYTNLEGTRFHDTRVENIHTGFFVDCAINVNPKAKEKISSKINQCRNIANLTNPETIKDIRNNVASIQNKMTKIFS
jgi:hypothetical protein